MSDKIQFLPATTTNLFFSKLMSRFKHIKLTSDESLTCVFSLINAISFKYLNGSYFSCFNYKIK